MSKLQKDLVGIIYDQKLPQLNSLTEDTRFLQ